MWSAAAIALGGSILLGSTARAETGLAVLTRDASVLGAPVNSTAPAVLYGHPDESDLVRVHPENRADWLSPDYRWARWADLRPGDQYEACLSDVAVGASMRPDGAPCVRWGFVPKSLAGCAAKKWNPGHYVRPNMLGFPSNGEERAGALERIRDEPLIRGGLITAPWGSIEPREGEYDFTPIEHDLQLMKSMGKKLIIEIWWQKYAGSVPDDRFFPRYIYDAGGVVAHPDGIAEHHVKIDEPRWQERYLALQAALAARFDGDPDVEQIVITETASTRAEHFLTLTPKVAALWPSTVTVLYANWVDTPELARDLLSMLAATGAGIGGPDVIGPPGFSYEDHGSRALRGVGRDRIWQGGPEGDFGSVDHRGKIPVSYQYQALSEVPARDLIDYAMNQLRVTHLTWSMDDEGSEGTNWTTGVLPVIRSVNGRTVTACPR